MGMFMDTIEDNLEFQGQFLQQYRLIRQEPYKNIEPIPLEKCPVCQKQLSFSELNQHIISEHQSQYSYLRVNDSIVRDKSSVQWIEKLEIVLLGYDNANIEIAGSNFQEEVNVTRSSELLDYIPNNYEGEIKLKIVFDQNQRKDKVFVIYNKSIPEFKNEELDNLIFEWQKELESSSKDLKYNPNFQSWKSQFEELPNKSDLSQRYFDGFLDYGIGLNLERKEKYGKAKEHLENAFRRLLPFRTKLSRTVVRLLGLKMNCFGVFKDCSLNSPFAPADAMFNNAQIPNGNKFKIAKTSETGVFIDSFSHLLLDTLESFYNCDENQSLVLLNTLKRNPFSSEKNNVDKLNFVSAKYFSYIGETQKAIEEFSILEYHPLFGNEAKRFLKSCRK